MTAPVGQWFPDPEGRPGWLRWWDGAQWSEHWAPQPDITQVITVDKPEGRLPETLAVAEIPAVTNGHPDDHVSRWKPHELERTCNRCAHTWYLTPQQKTAKPVKAGRGTGLVSSPVGKKRTAIRADRAMIELANQQAADVHRCSKCGSVSFAERRIALK